MKRKLFLIISLILVFSLIIIGCSSKSAMTLDNIASSDDYRGTEGMPSGGIPDVNMEYDQSKFTEAPYAPDKIITSVYISMETKEFDDTTSHLESLIKKYQAYVENSNISHNDYINSSRLKYADYTIRIPKENLENFTRDIKEIGNVIYETTSKDDITKSYRDTESRLRLLETKETRILALLEKADKMEDIIALENQLSDIIYQKESLSANLLYMDDKVDYSTLNFELREVAKLTEGASEKTPFATRLKNAINDSIYFFARNLEEFLLFLIYFLPYLIIILILIFILCKLKKRIKFKNPLNRKKDLS